MTAGRGLADGRTGRTFCIRNTILHITASIRPTVLLLTVIHLVMLSEVMSLDRPRRLAEQQQGSTSTTVACTTDILSQLLFSRYRIALSRALEQLHACSHSHYQVMLCMGTGMHQCCMAP